MKRFALVVVVMVLALMCVLGGHGLEGQAQGAMANKVAAVPAVTYVSSTTKGNITLWNAWVTILFPDGRKASGYASWTGGPDNVPVTDPNTWIFTGSGMSWHLLSDKEKKGVIVIVDLIDLGYGNGPYKPGSSATGL